LPETQRYEPEPPGTRDWSLTPYRRVQGTPDPGILPLSEKVSSSNPRLIEPGFPVPNRQYDSTVAVRRSRTKNPAQTSKFKRCSNLQEWAWVDSGLGPHAYQALGETAGSRQGVGISRGWGVDCGCPGVAMSGFGGVCRHQADTPQCLPLIRIGRHFNPNWTAAYSDMADSRLRFARAPRSVPSE
jgi:hypothetical protein